MKELKAISSGGFKRSLYIALWLDWMILKAFSNLNNSVILPVCLHAGKKSSSGYCEVCILTILKLSLKYFFLKFFSYFVRVKSLHP